jgi:PIN domain nuclease of toxin-antitoxin system
VNLLLDTHAFLWAAAGDPRLSERARSALLDNGNALHLSVVSAWEMAIKISLGKLRMPARWADAVRREMAANCILWLPLEVAHCSAVSSMPFHHRDPFDRVLAAQALVSGLGLVSRDPVFDAYGVERVW